MRQIHIVRGEHWTVPGSPMSAHFTRASADAAALALVNILRQDVGDGLPALPPGADWEAGLQATREAHAAEQGISLEDYEQDDELMEADVWIETLPIQDASPLDAAAPDLLAALEAVRYWNERNASDGIWDGLDDVMNLTDAAIAKARGQS